MNFYHSKTTNTKASKKDIANETKVNILLAQRGITPPANWTHARELLAKIIASERTAQ